MSAEELTTAPRRRYRKRRRAELEERTRRRITEAAVRLHGSVGPARTTVSAVAREAGVQRVLLASSIHAVGFHTPASVEAVEVPTPRPDTYYGVGKVVMEALGQLYADRFGMSVVAARLGTVEPEPTSIRSWRNRRRSGTPRRNSHCAAAARPRCCGSYASRR